MQKYLDDAFLPYLGAHLQAVNQDVEIGALTSLGVYKANPYWMAVRALACLLRWTHIS